MGILKIHDNYQSRKIVLCPECKGEKIISRYNEKTASFDFIDCPVCEGQGLMERIVIIKFKKI